jgi:hypothetical protein
VNFPYGVPFCDGPFRSNVIMHGTCYTPWDAESAMRAWLGWKWITLFSGGLSIGGQGSMRRVRNSLAIHDFAGVCFPMHRRCS